MSKKIYKKMNKHTKMSNNRVITYDSYNKRSLWLLRNPRRKRGAEDLLT